MGEYPRKQTALHMAAQYTANHDNDEIYNALLNYGADSDAQDDRGKTPRDVLQESKLAEASFNGDSEAVLKLLSRRTDPNAAASAWRTKDCAGTCKSPLALAIQGFHVDVVKILLAEGVGIDLNPAMRKRANGCPLHLAVQSGHEVLVGMLLLARADPWITVVDEVGEDWNRREIRTHLLALAIQGGHAGILKQFLDTGVVSDPMVLMEEALTGKHRAAVSVLLDARADPNGSIRALSRFDNGVNGLSDGVPLNFALHSPEIMNMLLDARADPGAAHTVDTEATESCNVSEDLFRGRRGSTVNVCQAPLMCALYDRNLAAASVLLKARANIDFDHSTKLSQKILLLEVAAAQGALAVVDALISARIDPTITLHETCRTIQWDHCVAGLAKMAKVLIEMEVLVERHALQSTPGPSRPLRLSNQKRCNFTLLHWASWQGHLKLVSVLIGARADLNFEAVRWHCEDVYVHQFRETPDVKALLENQADPGTANPLEVAVKEACGFGNRAPSRTHWRVVQYLLAANACPYAVRWQERSSKNGWSAKRNVLLLAAARVCETTIINKLLASAKLCNS
eukprot:TRINITY_DN37162_c0_g1_i1.p1 TRINITY_DN37162_c0_g1~~TRINITY_DN37162_c0_g1_i1.p1  ORF type:complete len:645 (-),score=52.96 TRINITY_DN37162_c0_g1_i1:231-1940(-)